MKKIVFLLSLSIILVASCTKTNEELIIGEWYCENHKIDVLGTYELIFEFKPDLSIKATYLYNDIEDLILICTYSVINDSVFISECNGFSYVLKEISKKEIKLEIVQNPFSLASETITFLKVK